MNQRSPQIRKKIEDYLALLTLCIRNNETSKREEIEDLLISINYFLKEENFTPRVSIGHKLKSPNSLTFICRLCNTQQYNIKTDCGHQFCRFCLKNSFLQQTNNTLLGKIVCPTCKVDVSSCIMYKTFGSTKKVSEIQQKAKKELGIYDHIPMFKCKICILEFSVEEGITLDCDDRFCKLCLDTYIKDLIYSNKVTENEFCCPICLKEISSFVVQGNFSQEVYEKYLDFKMNYYKPTKNYVFKKCPFCESLMEIYVETKSVNCKGCNKTFCPQCNEPHTSKNCRSTKNSIEIHEKVCPKCGEAVEMINGCNFMKCPWPQCKNSFFCYVCLKPLSRLQHYSHYFTKGPYGNTCNTLEGIKD